MLSLSNFFQPLNVYSFIWFFSLLIFFDILGTFVSKLVFKKDFPIYRIVHWIVGYGSFIFVWFLLSLVIPYEKNYVLLSIVVLLAISISDYIKNKEYISFFKEVWDLKFAILLIIPFLPAVFVKASLPPYYSDEMAYHFISPSALLHLEPIKYIGGLYADLPRIQNLFYEISFSLTKTYSIARLFHFTILSTSLIYTYKILKKNFSSITGFLFIFVFLSLPQEIILTSTLGYIDVAAYSFLLIAIVSGIDFLVNKNQSPLLAASLFWSMNLGTKYTGVSSFISFMVILVSAMVLYKKDYLKVNLKGLLIKFFLIFIVFGGYWYLKNFILFGNPIFPFLFPCLWGTYVERCPATGSFFGDWTTKINIANTYLILSQLFVKNFVIHFLVFITPVITLFLSNKRLKIIVFSTFLTVLIELLMLKYFSGFYIRYQQHMQLYLLLGIVIAVTGQYKNWLINLFSKLLVLVLIASSLYLYVYTVKYTNSLRFLNWHEINYSIGRLNIHEWIDFYFPRMKYTIRFCENPPNGQPVNLARFDPDLIWFDYDAYKRAFMLNCYYVNPISQLVPLDEVLIEAKKNKLQFWIASEARCMSQNQIFKRHPTERDDMLELRKLNNIIICHAEEVQPYLYYFDYSKIKNEH